MSKLLFLLATCVFAQNAWQEHTDLDGRFKVFLPGNFTQKTDTIKTEIGQLVYHTSFLQSESAEAENLFYMVSYCDYPSNVVFADSTGLTEEFFQATIEAAVESVDGTLAYSSDIKLDTHPGKQWRIDYLDGKAIIKNRAYLVRNRFYSIQTIAWKEKSLNTDGNRFLDSFKLIE